MISSNRSMLNLLKLCLIVIIIFYSSFGILASSGIKNLPAPGYELRIRNYIDSLRVIDTHEHLFTPEIIKGSYFLDFMLLFQPNSYEDLLSAGMPDSLFSPLFNEQLLPSQKWRLIEPYWNNSFNTSFNRNIITAVRSLYGIDDLNESSVVGLSEKIEKAYASDWFDKILRDSCKIDYIIQDGYHMPGKDDYFRYAKRFDDWILIKSKYRIDSLAINQLDPIYSLEDFVKSLRTAFEKEVRKGMTVVKIFIAYSRTLSAERVETEAARKVFRSLVNGNEDKVISLRDARPLQDYMYYQLLNLAKDYNLPVAFHTGLQSGSRSLISNSNPSLLVPVFKDFPEINFVLFHGSYPFGGELSAIAKNYRNVFIDMNWTYSISPSYSERYLSEWLETVPVSKIMAFGGDCMVVENVYSELKTAKNIISNVLINKVKDGYLTEKEAKVAAKMIIYDNAAKFYNLHLK
jgi:predicted TIM-barrel fold metal-dependent hydrolase